MTRTEGDSWDLASSVGATATMVAAARAMATRDPRGLINDPFAEPLVRAVGLDFFVRLLDGDIPESAIGEAERARLQRMVDRMALRTRFFDDYLADSTAGGVRQVVILASGLDSRAYRLNWPAETVVYEIDQPEVISFKADVMSQLGVAPAAVVRTVGTDLREDWPTALRQAGFDPQRSTAWLVEGLLIYLPPEAQDLLVDTIGTLSGQGSTIATEYVPGIVDFDEGKVREMSARFRDHGLDLDMASLVYSGPRNNVIDYLSGAGWRVRAVPRNELFSRSGIPAPGPEVDDALGEIVYVSADRMDV